MMMYNSNDIYIGKSLDIYGEYSESEIELFNQLVKSDMTVLDVGANIGTHTVMFGNAVGPKGKVIAFEPQHAIFHMLCGNIALNGLTNISAMFCAIGSQSGTANVPCKDLNRKFNFGGTSLLEKEEGEEVSIITIDSMHITQCEFIKIDVEGMELEVLQGAIETIKYHWPIIYFENNHREKSPVLLKFLQDLKYKLYWHYPPLFNENNFTGTQENIFGEIVSINVLAIPENLQHLPISGSDEITDISWFPNTKQEIIIVE